MKTVGLDKEIDFVEGEKVGSFNHGFVQIKLGAKFLSLGYTPSSELSIDITSVKDEFDGFGSTLLPDIAVYDERVVDYARDPSRVFDAPLLVVEILSPMQPVSQLIDKLPIYFALGVQSCWIVYPFSKTVTVYASEDEFESFASGNVIDQTLGIKIPFVDIF